jgi:uncharacterized membrane protein
MEHALSMMLEPLLLVPMAMLGWHVPRLWWLLATPVVSWVYAVAATYAVTPEDQYVSDGAFYAWWGGSAAAILVGYAVRRARLSSPSQAR